MYNKTQENIIIECLKRHGLEFRSAIVSDKMERFLVTPDGDKKIQVKFRRSGNDILIDVFEPFYGVQSDRTKYGRDYVSQYDVFICLNGKEIKVIDGKRQKEVIEEILVEWKDNKWQLPVFDSKKYEGCQIKYTRDRISKTPKILMFINPAVYKENEIKIYGMEPIALP